MREFDRPSGELIQLANSNSSVSRTCTPEFCVVSTDLLVLPATSSRIRGLQISSTLGAEGSGFRLSYHL